MTIVNMIPHDVEIVDANGTQIRVFRRSGLTIRCKTITVTITDIDGTSITHTAYGAPIVVDENGNTSELPPYEEGMYYIVSSLVAQGVKRNDFLVPNESVRDEAGRIVSCKSFRII